MQHHKKHEVENLEGKQEYSYSFRKRYRRPGDSIFGAFFFMSIGVLLLMVNFGIVSPDVWSYLWRFWPGLLILWGFQMLFGRSGFSRFVISLIAVLVLFLIIAMAIGSTNPVFSTQLHNFLPWLPSPQTDSGTIYFD